MTRDTVVFGGFVFALAAVNALLLATGRLPANWEGLGLMLASGLTLCLYSFLYKDNPLFKLGEHAYVGVSAGYTLGQVWYPTLYGEIVVPLTGAGGGAKAPDAWLLVPTALGLLMLTRFSGRFNWLSRIAFAFVIGLGAGFSIPRTISAKLLAQIEPTLSPLSLTAEGINLFLILVGVLTVLVYFFFSVEHTGAVGAASRVGIWFLMVSFGASFGYTIMARVSLLIGRMDFLLQDWLRLSPPLF